MKKMLTILLAGLTAASLLASCGSEGNTSSTASGSSETSSESSTASSEDSAASGETTVKRPTVWKKLNRRASSFWQLLPTLHLRNLRTSPAARRPMSDVTSSLPNTLPTILALNWIFRQWTSRHARPLFRPVRLTFLSLVMLGKKTAQRTMRSLTSSM